MYLLQRLLTLQNFVGKLFELEWKLKNWTAFKNEYHLLGSKNFQWMQLVDALKTLSKEFAREENTCLNDLSLYIHHVIKKKQVYSLGKLNSKKL